MLEFKKKSEETVKAMKDAVDNNVDYYSLATSKVNELLGDGEVHILNSANSCLLSVAESVQEPILVQDMGGWNGFIKSCEVFGKSVDYIATDEGLINIEVLSNYLETNSVKTLYVTSLAGYTAKQDLSSISNLCDVHDVVLIVDLSGSIGDEKLNCYGDIKVSSTGSPKIINVENGGFIHNSSNIRFNNHLLKSLKADNITCAGIIEEISNSLAVEEKTLEMNSYLKGKLNESLKNSDYSIVHPYSDGLNVMIRAASKSKAKKLAYNIRQKLESDGNIITTGPNYNRVKKASIIIETKNLDITSLTIENMDYIHDIVINEIKKLS